MSGDEQRKDDWGWEHHARDQRLRFARLTLIEKLQWLEETHGMIQHMQASRLGHGEEADRKRPPEGD